jgi:hypothetical protein
LAGLSTGARLPETLPEVDLEVPDTLPYFIFPIGSFLASLDAENSMFFEDIPKMTFFDTPITQEMTQNKK